METRFVKGIIKQLEIAASGAYRQSEVFDDFLSMTLAALESIPDRLKAQKEGQQYQDTPEVAALFTKLHKKYQPYQWEAFHKAFAVLMSSTEDYQDTIGTVYMDFGYPSTGNGQFFTPMEICKMMARITLQDIQKDIIHRLVEATEGDIFATALLLSGIAIKDPEEAYAFFMTKLLPVIAGKVKPINVSDPCCGSGAMFLAAASVCPPWAVASGLVQFWGTDIDQTCCDMAKINLMLYGLNGFGVKCALSMTDAELQALPEPYNDAYSQAKEFHETGDLEKVTEIREQIAFTSYSQATLFQ